MNPSQRALPGRMTSVSIVAYRQRIPAGVIAVLLTSLWACSPSETDAVVEGLGSARESVEPGSLPGLSDVMRAKQPPACRGSGACDDGNPCTFNDKCVKGLCLGTAYSCNDGNACTTDICDGTGRCRFVANTAACDDGNACTTGDVCSAGRCSGAPLSCDDGNLCTTDSCDPAVGCVHTANNASCDDGNPCTNDSCDPTVGCVHTANTAPCDDGNACTTGDVCSAGICRGTPGACCASYELSCTNGVDDDCDGLVDRDDPDCQCLPGPETACSNGRDDDCDGLTDSEDPDCALLECTDGCPYGYGCFPDNYCHSHCEDGAPDYDESDDDCGGSDCLRCGPGRRCNTGFDCASGICITGVCR